MFRSLLIANRGEIAVRIVRTARRMGIRTIAVYSEADAEALHVRLADAAVPIGPAPARDSYLRADRIIEAARLAGAEAIHPGYGFLSEKIELPTLCAEHGIAWVGPHAKAIAAMGSKIEAKRLAAKAGVPVVPGYDGEDQNPGRLEAEALRTGLPVMIKASAGGGGKGMRAVASAEALAEALGSARREAEAAFGDGRLLIEKLITRPRHVEVQVIGDKHGNLVHLYERDCSVQRNNQKLLEEAPAPHLSDATRAALHRHAVRLASAIGYDSTGTMEFIVDAATEEVFFLEMNTRLQVEHTVTEAITGLDLVEWQLRVAAGERLGFAQGDIMMTGHAIQARLTAERADEGFRPDAGRIALWSPPSDIRVDSGVETGTIIGLSYDSLLAKLIVSGADRPQALQRLAAALDDLTVLGPATNRAFLADAVRTEAFAEGRATTRLIAETWPDGWTRDAADLVLARRLAALAMWMAGRAGERRSPWSNLQGFRLLAAGATPFSVSADGTTALVTVTGDGRHFTLADADGTTTVEASCDREVLTAVTDGAAIACRFAIDGRHVAIRARSVEAAFRVLPASEAALLAGAGASVAGGANIIAPMPGLIAEIRVAVGDEVAAGQTLAVLESMKLFTDLKSACDGRVERIAAEPGKTVSAGALIVAVKPAETPAP
ncbi:biotin carboxylase N-terminal domain-containing protein [Phreatobacter stygius]|uniref:Biotin/lipoyl-binding protein n=1 Tax=Phreatobacter stygius TaxID=1940610 RepID=A0A4D7B7W7_9HYPH|nr:biotin carboxylase N-terminal domain-containing protein [Phreatobacter stygius]QCI67065.1 biotin/lipoyl-binding protein [Phreatobacter stygius]